MIAVKDKELKMLDKAASEFAKKQLAPEREENDKFPFGPFFDDVLAKAFELDFFHIILPESLDGMNQGMAALSVILDNLCREDSSLGGIVFTNSAAQQVMLEAGATDLLADIVSAESINDFLIAFPVFNNPAEVPHLAEATPDGNGFTLSGKLEYMVLGGISGHCLVPAKIAGQDGYSYFLVNTKDNNVTVSDPVLSLGLRACPAVDIDFNNSKAALVGNQGEGDTYFTKMADRLHAAAAAMAAGVMKGSFNEAFSYSKERFQGGQAIINWSEMKMMLSNMAIAIENADMILATAVSAVDNQFPGWERSSRAAALQIQASACELTTDGIQALGGVGYMKDFGQEKRFRDAKHIQALLGIAPMKRIKYIEALLK
ncbi:MAG: acyl-CoA dehydrogenase family protein [Thermodesulfobacteriota bacterium]|nr:acyl-CoA dehydrogenase family protein [Thermodesulfobacteriota bacterium]